MYIGKSSQLKFCVNYNFKILNEKPKCDVAKDNIITTMIINRYYLSQNFITISSSPVKHLTWSENVHMNNMVATNLDEDHNLGSLTKFYRNIPNHLQ